jgi:hypothetical protein
LFRFKLKVAYGAFSGQPISYFWLAGYAPRAKSVVFAG